MKKLLLLSVLFLSITSCRQENEALKIATDYVNKSILPIFPCYKISTANPPSVRFLKRTNLEQLTITNKLESLRLEVIERKQRDLRMRTTQINMNTFREDIIISSLNISDIEALNSVNSEEGFYDIDFTIESADNMNIVGLTIVVSKDLRLINKPIDMNKINQIVDKIN